MVVSRGFVVEANVKLFSSPLRVPGTLGRAVRKVSTFCATGSKPEVMIFPGKAVRHCTGFPPTKTVLVVDGSKIWPFMTALPSHGLMAPVGPLSKAEKSPVSSAGVGNVVVLLVPGLLRYCSQEKKK